MFQCLKQTLCKVWDLDKPLIDPHDFIFQIKASESLWSHSQSTMVASKVSQPLCRELPMEYIHGWPWQFHIVASTYVLLTGRAGDRKIMWGRKGKKWRVLARSHGQYEYTCVNMCVCVHVQAVCSYVHLISAMVWICPQRVTCWWTVDVAQWQSSGLVCVRPWV